MAVKGALAKQLLINKIMAALQDEYIGTDGSKYYFALPEGGTKVQVAISMTCPKAEFDPASGEKKKKDEGIDFTAFAEAPVKPIGSTKPPRIEPEQEELENKKKLLSALGF